MPFLAGEILPSEAKGFLHPSFGTDRSVCQGKTSGREGLCRLPPALSSLQRTRPAFCSLPALGIRADSAANTPLSAVWYSENPIEG